MTAGHRSAWTEPSRIRRAAFAGLAFAFAVILPACSTATADRSDNDDVSNQIGNIGDQRGDAARELADRYAPIVMTVAQDGECDSGGEPFVPMSVDAILGNDDIALRQVSRGDPVVARGPTASDLHELGEGFYLDAPGDSLTPSCLYERDARRYTRDQPAVVYAHVVQQEDRPDRLALQYWFFWYYNDWNNTHESDWEGIQLLFAASTIDEALADGPISVGYAQHEGGERADWDSQKLERDGDRPVVYSSVGSHASYYDASVYIGRGASSGFGCDSTLGPSTRIDPDVVLLPSAVDDPDDPVAWLAFDGRWGERQSGPFDGPIGPRAKERWERPVDWHDSLRDSSVVVPTGGSQGARLVGAFCDVVESGSGLLLRAVSSPVTMTVALALAALVVRGLARRTDWSAVPARPLVMHRRVGQILRCSLRSLVSARPIPLLFGWVHLAAVVLSGVVVVLASSLPVVGVLVDLVGDDSATGVVIAALAGGSVGSIGVYAVSALVSVEWSTTPGSSTHRSVLVEAGRRWRDLLSTFVLAAAIVTTLAVSIVGIPWAIRQTVRYGLIAQVVVVEGRAGTDALRRSSELVRGRWWTTAVALGCLNALRFGVQLAVGLLLLTLTEGVPLWLFSALLPFATALVVPVVAIGTTLVYGDAVAEGSRAAASEAFRDAEAVQV